MRKECHHHDCLEEGEKEGSTAHWLDSLLVEEEFESRYFARLNKSSQKTSNKKEARKSRGQYSYGPRGRSNKQRVPQQRKRQELRNARRQAKAERLSETYSRYWEKRYRPSSQSCPRRASATPIIRTTRTAPYHQRQPYSTEQTAEAVGASLGLPPARELGLNATMYSRLVQIATGAEIGPEDYDLLLLLDEKNSRTTMKDISGLEVLMIAGTKDDEQGSEHGDYTVTDNYFMGEKKREAESSDGSIRISRHALGNDSLCLICLQPFSDLEEGTKLCRLPCRHVFCHSCIEVWLRERSAKCPDLSCFWQAAKDRYDGGKSGDAVVTNRAA